VPLAIVCGVIGAVIGDIIIKTLQENQQLKNKASSAQIN